MVSSTASDETESALNSVVNQEGPKSYEKKALLELKARLEEAIVTNQLLKPRGRQNHDKRNSRVVAHPCYPDDNQMLFMIPKPNEDYKISNFKLWEVPLQPSQGHESTDLILMKFLNAKEMKVSDALDMIRDTLVWREEFGADGILDEEGLDMPELEKVTFMNGKDRSGQPVCYNMYGVFKDKELYRTTFGDEEQREKFVRWRVRCMEKGIRQLSFKSGAAESILQVIDLKDCLAHSMKEFRTTTKKVVSILEDNYPEFVSKNVSHSLVSLPIIYANVLSFFLQN
jgi:CRAL/TRIO domain